MPEHELVDKITEHSLIDLTDARFLDDEVRTVLFLPGARLGKPVSLHHALDTTAAMILIVDAAGRALYANRAARGMLALDEADRAFGPVETLLTGPQRNQVWDELSGRGEWRGEVAAVRADSTPIILDIAMLADPGADGEIHTLTIVAHDVGERRALEAALEHQATHDGLTGLRNRQHLLRELDRTLYDLHEAGRPGALMLIDIDEFRTVTNSLGHEAGDRILVAFAYRLLRTFPTNTLLARIGGDEFAVFCPGSDEVGALTQQIDRATTPPFYIDGSEVHLSAVTGIAIADPGGPLHTGEELLREADAATYSGKERGRGGHEIFAPQLQEAAADRLSVVRDLRRAIRDDELTVHYQPKIDLDSGAITGAEALVRWALPDGSMRSPASFLDIAEDTGLIIPIGRQVLEQACRDVQHLTDVLGDQAPLSVSVNLSVRQLAHPDFVEEITDVIAASGIDARRIELEVTESAIMHDVGASADLLQQLKDLGLRISIDDFGTGHSSLRYLQQLPVDVLKIDQSFVAGLESGNSDDAIVTSVVTLARALGLEAVAEGVETIEQLVRLREVHCTMAQGYHIARPMPVGDLVELLRSAPRW